MVKSIAVEKAVWLCRRNSSIIEIWDVGRCKMTLSINVADFIRFAPITHAVTLLPTSIRSNLHDLSSKICTWLPKIGIRSWSGHLGVVSSGTKDPPRFKSTLGHESVAKAWVTKLQLLVVCSFIVSPEKVNFKTGFVPDSM